MAVNKGFGIDFSGFLDYAEEISKISDKQLLQIATQTLELTKDYVNGEISKVVNGGGASQWSFDKGIKYSQGTAKDSFNKVANMPVEVVGNQVTAYAGFDLADAPEVMLIVYGTPHKAKDKKLYNAVKVKGKIKKEVERIQSEAFSNALQNLQNLQNL